MNDFNFPKGSEWRKWDLHVHTPLSYLNNQFGSDFDEYVKQLFKKALEKNIVAIGITDYFTIEGYKKLKRDYLEKETKLKELFSDDEIEKIKQILVLPNIEFRLDKIVGKNRINFHVIFTNKISIRDIEENFLHEIDFVREGIPQSEDDKRKLKIENLKELGCKLKTENSDFEKNDSLFVGMKCAVVDDSQIVEILNKKLTLFKGNFLIGVPADEDLSKIDWNSQDHNVRKVIIQKSDFLFSSNDNTWEWGLGLKHDNIAHFIYEFKSLKPCIWGSDSHSYEKLFEPDLKKYTWIKADPTFEGLKQIIYEPEERIYIGEEPLRKIERNKVIKSITISNSKGWFEDRGIPLNEGLISVIGGKGTGKTAILDLIAYATGSYKCYEKDENKSKSFLKKAFKELRGTKIKVEWEDSSPDEKEIGEKLEEFNKDAKARYLPQDYVDQLCSEIGKNVLERQIEDVIFQKIPLELKASFTDFKSYKDAQLKVINDKKSRVALQIKDKNSEIYEYKLLIKSRESKNEEKKKIEGEIKRFEDEIRKISEGVKGSKEQTEILNKLQTLTEQKSNLEMIVSQLRTKLLKIEEIENEISTFIENVEAFLDKLKRNLKDVEIEQGNIEKVKVVLYPENIKQTLGEKKKSIEDKIKNAGANLKEIVENINELHRKKTLEKSKQDKIKEINKSLSELKKKKDSLDEDIKKIKDTEKIFTLLLEKRQDLFINYFEIIFEENEKLKEIYSPLENILQASGEENKKLFDFTVQFNFDLNSMADEGHELIDLRADGMFRQSRPEVLREELEKLRFRLCLDNKILKDNREQIKGFLKKVEELFTKDGRTIISQLKEKKYTEQDFDNWLYSTKYYSINYSIKFNNIELNNLSPGLKGVALLILFLELDEEDKRPILIDQPEENLDNRSVYYTLVRYFRDAKKRRQVIIVTHNPNLVVNTDSEQIIVANFDMGLKKQTSRISYISGSLENTFKNISKDKILEKQGIREHVCEILEGGREAFEKREKKYGFKYGI
jgi:hypothetical protein